MPKEIYYPRGTVVNGYEILDTIKGHYSINMKAYKNRCINCGTLTISSIYSIQKKKCRTCYRHQIIKKLTADPRVIKITHNIKQNTKYWKVLVRCTTCFFSKQINYPEIYDVLEQNDNIKGCKCRRNHLINPHLSGSSYSEKARQLGVCKETVRMITYRKLNPSKEQHLGTLRTWYSKKSNA